MSQQRLAVAISMGDPAGIGPEICLQALSDPAVLRDAIPIVFGDAGILRRVAQQLDRPAAPAQVLSQQAVQDGAAFDQPTIIDVTALDDRQCVPGTVTAETGNAAFHYFTAALDSVLAGQTVALTTGPINKEAVNAAGIPFPGHTELVAARTGCQRYCMMLTAPALTCALVTTHVGLADVASGLRAERIVEVAELLADHLRRVLRRAPRIAVCGLNPHAGEHGLFGHREEERIIAPAVEALRADGLEVCGPLSPDTAFVPEMRDKLDGYVCMYHDQGLIPLKTLAFDEAVNVTLGLPIVRTSVDHGTALDIAWQGRAQTQSLQHAVLLAAQLAHNPVDQRAT